MFQQKKVIISCAVTGKPDQRPEAFTPFLKIIKQRSGAIVNLATGGSPCMAVNERMQPAKVLKPEVASMGAIR
jgi:uncharacterized protein (DUF849 family)